MEFLDTARLQAPHSQVILQSLGHSSPARGRYVILAHLIFSNYPTSLFMIYHHQICIEDGSALAYASSGNRRQTLNEKLTGSTG